jgi:hypothetical protein
VKKLDNYTIIKWISITHERNQFYNVSYLEVFDEGDETFTDIIEFSPLDPDLLSGIVTTFSSIDKMLQFVQDRYNASLVKFVSQGMIGREYLDYLKAKP